MTHIVAVRHQMVKHVSAFAAETVNNPFNVMIIQKTHSLFLN